MILLFRRSGDPLYTRVEKSQAKSKKVLPSKIQNEPTGTKMQRAKKQDVQVEAIVDDEKREKSSELPLILLWNRYQASRLFYISYPARVRSARARRACVLRALGLLLADGVPTV